MHPFILSKLKEINDRTYLSCRQQQQWEAVPPTNSWRALRQWLLRTPELALVSLDGTRCSKSDTSLQLSVNSELSISSLISNSCNQNQVTTNIHSKHFLTVFPSFLNEILESHSPEWILSGIKTEQPELSSLSTFKDCLGLSWVNCHLMTHLLTFHFLGESWPQI